MDIDFLPDWIYTFLVLPITILFQRYFVMSSRVTVLEKKDLINDEKFEKLCNSVDELTKEVHKLVGTMNEHLRVSSS
ncbi:MAG: hypothetical protein HRU07_01270 [Nitrosopumilus sp.]|nr:hypothetical protein [Nitrosopumilus sp.]NRA04804.1 hypothetical protein [Nitrosopumilus sp.]